MRILIADDSRTLRAALGDQLRAMGHEVTEAHEGLQAIDLFRVHEPDLIVLDVDMPVMNGYETARHLGAKAMFVEREQGVFQLRRGFAIREGERVLMVEDVVTTGLSSRECLDAIRNHPGELVAAACLIDRSGGKADIGAKLISLAQVEAPAYAADQLPPELAALPAVKPGSRGLAA